MIFHLTGLIHKAMIAVPAVKYAMGVAGLLSVVAMVKVFQLPPGIAALGVIVVLVLMVALLVFSRLAAFPPESIKWAALILMWGSLSLVLATAGLLFSHVFTGWPEIRLDPITAPATPRLPIVAIEEEVHAQLQANDYPSAWNTLDKVLKTPHSEKDAMALLPLQAETAMAWIRNLSVVSPQKYSDVVDNLLPVLYRTAQENKGVAAADALAHIGWVYFLKYRDGIFNLDIEGMYRTATDHDHDPDNPFAHAMWGHWLIVKGNNVMDAQQHFDAALKSGREREFVRQFQLAGLQWYGGDKNALALIRVCNEMRKENATLSQDDRKRLLENIYFSNKDAVLANLDQILPAGEHLLTFQWLTHGMDESRSIEQRFFFARLQEANGNCEEALRLYVGLLGSSPRWSNNVREGLSRCNQQSTQPKSEIAVLIDLLSDPSGRVRREAVDGLSVILTNGGEIDMKVFSSVLADPDPAVRAAAANALASSGHRAVPMLTELLGSSESTQRIRAARVLAEVGAAARPAVPSLVRMLDAPEDDVQKAALDALANLGPEAEPAAALIKKMLNRNQTLDMRKALIFTLGEIGPAAKAAVPEIIEALKDQRDHTGFLRVVAADALGKIGPGAVPAVPALIEALSSDDVRLPTNATTALGNIGAAAKAAIPELIVTMRRQEKPHMKNQAMAVGQIAQALASQRDRRALPILRSALRAEEEAGLDIATISPLREAIDLLATQRP